MERAVERALQHRNGDPPHAAQTSGRDAALAPGLAHDPDGLDQLRRERQRDRHRDAGLVEHRRERAEEPVGAGQRVRRAEAQQDHGDLQSLHEGIEDRLHGHRTADAHRRRPRGQRHLRQGEEHMPGDAALTEEDLDHHPDHNDQHADAEEERDGA